MENNKQGKQDRQIKHYKQTSFVGVAPQLGHSASGFGFVFDSGDVVQLCKYEYMQQSSGEVREIE